MITVLCVDDLSNYYLIPDLDLYNKARDAYTYIGTNPIIAHPPCQQWSRLKSFAKNDIREKELAVYCWELVNKNGGIFEHPAGSSFFNYIGANRKKITSVDQHHFGFPARKRTYLYTHNVKLLSQPLTWELPKSSVQKLSYKKRSRMTLYFCKYLVESLENSKTLLS